MSPVSRDLFHQVILQSSSFYDVSYHPQSASESSRLAGLVLSELACEEPGLASDCLTEADLTRLMTAALRVESDTDNWGWGELEEQQVLF